MFSLDDSLVFDPFELTEDVTPEAVETAIKDRFFLKALLVPPRYSSHLFVGPASAGSGLTHVAPPYR